MLDPAPAAPLPDGVLGLTDILTPNQTETATLIGEPPPATAEAAAQAAGRLLERGCAAVAVKLGDQGSLWRDAATVAAVPAFPVEARDAVGAGDVFNAALAVALSEGQTIEAALQFANAAAAISVTRPGAQAAAPGRHEVEALRKRWSWGA